MNPPPDGFVPFGPLAVQATKTTHAFKFEQVDPERPIICSPQYATTASEKGQQMCVVNAHECTMWIRNPIPHVCPSHHSRGPVGNGGRRRRCHLTHIHASIGCGCIVWSQIWNWICMHPHPYPHSVWLRRRDGFGSMSSCVQKKRLVDTHVVQIQQVYHALSSTALLLANAQRIALFFMRFASFSWEREHQQSIMRQGAYFPFLLQSIEFHPWINKQVLGVCQFPSQLILSGHGCRKLVHKICVALFNNGRAKVTVCLCHTDTKYTTADDKIRCTSLTGLVFNSSVAATHCRPGEVVYKRNTIESLRGTHVYVDWNTVFRIPQFGYRCVFAMYFADPPVTTRDPKLLSDLLKAIQRHTVCDTTDWGWKSQYTNHTSRDTCSSRDGFLRNKKDRSNHGVPSQTKNTGHGAGTEGCWGWDWGVLHCIHSDVGDFRIDGQIYGIYGQDWLKQRAQAFDTNKGNDTYRVVHTVSHLVLRPGGPQSLAVGVLAVRKHVDIHKITQTAVCVRQRRVTWSCGPPGGPQSLAVGVQISNNVNIWNAVYWHTYLYAGSRTAVDHRRNAGKKWDWEKSPTLQRFCTSPALRFWRIVRGTVCPPTIHLVLPPTWCILLVLEQLYTVVYNELSGMMGRRIATPIVSQNGVHNWTIQTK